MDILNHHSDAPWTNKVYESQDLICYKDKYPVTEGHLLIVPKKKDPTTIGEAFKLAYVEGQTMVREYCDSFNVGMNSGVEVVKLLAGLIFIYTKKKEMLKIQLVE